MSEEQKTGLQLVEGKYYYYDDSGNIKKNFIGVFDGLVLKFGEDGSSSIMDNTVDVPLGTYYHVNTFSSHNEAYDYTDKSFTNVEGYITPRTWYRPKSILSRGIFWRNSKSTEFRPLLMLWKPDIITSVNYINFMIDKGYLYSNIKISKDTDSRVLSLANNEIQRAIEKRIYTKGIKWLNTLMDEFIATQPQWNFSSESESTDHLQGGALLYKNSELTPNSNSNYRLINRTPTNQTGVQKYFVDNSLGGYELLLASDVDNSNPSVQAEQLNWIHFLMNFGDIVANDSNANFDGIRVDAVDNVDADLLQIASDYFKYHFGSGKNDYRTNSHISILEDWSYNDPIYVNDFGNPQLSMDATTQTQLLFSLSKPPRNRAKMSRFTEWFMVDRRNDTLESNNQPNYSFFRAHDSEVQTVIAQIIQDLHPGNSNGLIPTMDELNEAFLTYNKDMNSVVKKYTQYNTPAAYAMLLTNKDTVPRVYYGDLYTDDGKFMGKKSPYYEYIDVLLRARRQFSFGGQTLNVNSQDVLTSVRFGKGVSTADDVVKSARDSGIAVIVSNNPELISANDIIINMGKSHANQSFRALIDTDDEGLHSYIEKKDSEKVFKTDDQGLLTIPKSNVNGKSFVEVSGYLSVWIPDEVEITSFPIPTTGSRLSVDDEEFFHSNEELDTNVIFEAFSNFQEIPTKREDFENVILKNNVGLLKDWGITSVQLPPQYRSSTDTTFLDSIIKNGYAFTDRYDLGFDSETKYGNVDDLVSLIKELHKFNIQAMADFVPDQLYNLTQQEVTMVSRTNAMGVQNDTSDINNILYLTNSKGGGTYQKKYGGKFLDSIKKSYPEIFSRTQISTGETIDNYTKIPEWSAKYLNGSAIQGHGASSVLSDSASNEYFKVGNKENGYKSYLPNQLTDSGDYSYSVGFIVNSDGTVSYVSPSGYKAVDSIVTVDGEKYYFDATGVMATGIKLVKGDYYYFSPNGKAVRNAFVQDDKGSMYYIGATGRAVKSSYVHDSDYNYYYADLYGKLVQNKQVTIGGKTQYFNLNGVQVKGNWVTDELGNMFYYHNDSGNMAVKEYIMNNDGTWSYFGDDGKAVQGFVTVSGKLQYFDESFKQVKGGFAKDKDGNIIYFDSNLGNQVISEFYQVGDFWYYSDATGHVLTGLNFVNVSGENRLYNFEPNSGVIIRNKTINYNGKDYNTNEEGYVVI